MPSVKDEEIIGLDVSEIDASKIDLVDLIEQPAWKTILLELVRTERMDPWNIDLMQLSDKYLQKINYLGGTDLRLPANAILACAILLKFKSRVLKFSSLDEDEFERLNRDMTPDEKHDLDGLLPDLSNIRKIREGKISLDQLVESIEAMLDKSKSRQDKRFIKMDRPDFLVPSSDFNIDEKMEEVYALIREKADSQGLTTFSVLVNGGNVNEIVETFIPCLFLYTNHRINLWQEEFFGEIFISLIKSNEKI